MANKLILVLILLILTSCTPLEVHEDSRISSDYVKDYHKVIFTYNSRVKNVRLEGVIIESDKEYYIKGDEYILTYEYVPKFTLGMEVSYNREDRNGGDNEYTGLSRERETIVIAEDKVIEVLGKNVEINFTGEAGS